MKYRITLLIFLVSGSFLAQQEPKEKSPYKKLILEAKQKSSAGKYKEAEEIYTRMLKKNSRDVDVLVARGNARLRIKGSTSEALKDFRKVVVLSPGYLDAHIGLATALRRTGDKQDAEKVLTEAVRLCGENEKKKKYLADTAWDFGHWDFARELEPKYRDIQSETEKNQVEYKKTLEQARELRLEGFVEDAEEIYLELLIRNPDDVDAMAGLGFCKLRDAKRLDEALEAFTTVIKLSPLYVDAYIGAAICYKRQDDRDALYQVLDDCRTACEGNAHKSRYLAATAWREGYYPLARELDDEFPPEDDRQLINEPVNLRVTYGHNWLEEGEDWDELRISGSWRIRPDIRIRGEFDQWWRYRGRPDFTVGLGVAYRHDYRWSASYKYEVSDPAGYLADERHAANLRYRLYKRLHIYGGPRMAIYDQTWSRRLKIGADVSWKKFLVYGNYSFGTDTRKQDVASWSAALGYYEELRWSLLGGYSNGDETVNDILNDKIVFSTDEVESIFLRGTIYFTDTCGLSLGGMYEYRNSDLFRRELTGTLFKSF